MDKKDIHKIVLWYVLSVCAVAVTVVAVGGILNWESSLTPARTLTVSAQGKTTAAPDLAEVSFSVISQGPTADTLNAANDQKMTAAIDFVKSLGIASSDITTTNYDIEPNYETNTVTVPFFGSSSAVPTITVPVRTTSSSTITGYTLTETVLVKIRDFTNIAKLLGGLPPLGINQVSGVTFTFNDPDTFLAVARADAMIKARAKAAEMAAEAGVSLGKVMSVQEYGNIPVFSPVNYRMASPMATEAASTPTIEPGTQDITDQVTMVYELK
jgi:uncharacterized protein YggE